MSLTLVLLIAFAAPLDEDPVFVEGLSLFRELEFEQAAIRFEQVGLDTARPNEDRARVLVWLGVCQAKVGAFDPARASFDLAVRLDPAAKLPVEVGPRVVEMFEAARAAAPPPEPDPPPEPTPQPEPTPEPEPTPVPEPEPEPTPEPGPTPEPDPQPAASTPVLPIVLGVGAGVFAVAALAAGGLAGSLIAEANDLTKTQVQATEIYESGLLVGASAVAAGVIAVGLGAYALVAANE